MSLPLPSNTHLPDTCRYLSLPDVAGISREFPPSDGGLVLAEVVEGGGSPAIDLAGGRVATLFPGDHLVVALGHFVAPIATSAELPARWGEAALVHRTGVAGIPTAAAPNAALPVPLRLLGALIDHENRVMDLDRIRAPLEAGARPLHSIAVVSAARGTRAAAVAGALVRGFHRTGLRVGTAKPVGMPDAVERWHFRDCGAIRMLDLVDAGRLCADGLCTEQLFGIACGMLGDLASRSTEAAVVRIAGGIATREVSGLLAGNALHGLVDGIVLAATDALSAIEAASRLERARLRLLAVSGAITRSPLACREAARELSVPVLAIEELARPPILQRLLITGARVNDARSPTMSLAA